MARIEGTGETTKRPLRARLPRVRLEPRSLVAAVLFAPIVLLAPNEFIAALVLGVVIPSAWLYGYHEGRADHAREVIRELRANDR